jgi:hypothetical protein
LAKFSDYAVKEGIKMTLKPTIKSLIVAGASSGLVLTFAPSPMALAKSYNDDGRGYGSSRYQQDESSKQTYKSQGSRDSYKDTGSYQSSRQYQSSNYQAAQSSQSYQQPAQSSGAYKSKSSSYSHSSQPAEQSTQSNTSYSSKAYKAESDNKTYTYSKTDSGKAYAYTGSKQYGEKVKLANNYTENKSYGSDDYSKKQRVVFATTWTKKEDSECSFNNMFDQHKKCRVVIADNGQNKPDCDRNKKHDVHKDHYDKDRSHHTGGRGGDQNHHEDKEHNGGKGGGEVAYHPHKQPCDKQHKEDKFHKHYKKDCVPGGRGGDSATPVTPTTTTPEITTGGRGAGFEITPTVAQMSLGGRGAEAVQAAASSGPATLPFTGSRDETSFWSLLAAIVAVSAAFYWRKAISPFLKK